MTNLHKDPTLEAAQRLEIAQKRCGACQRRVMLSSGDLRCGVGKTFPACRGQRGGFALDVRCGVAA